MAAASRFEHVLLRFERLVDLYYKTIRLFALDFYA